MGKRHLVRFDPVSRKQPIARTTKSWEVGMNFRFLKDFNFDATWYQADTYNQTFNPNVPVGKYSKIYVQTGKIRNWGMEFALGFDHTWNNSLGLPT